MFSLQFIDEQYEERVIASIDAEFQGQCEYYCFPDEFADLLTALQQRWLPPGEAIRGVWLNGCVRLLIEPHDALGHLTAKVHIRDHSSEWTMGGAELSISYSDLDRFQNELSLVLADGQGTATLRAAA